MKIMSLFGAVWVGLLLSDFAGAHGEDKPGPNQGHVQMPGAFHTELVLEADQSVRVYLIDIEFKNPTVKDSSVELRYKDGKDIIPFKCAPMGTDHFHCFTRKKYSLKKGELLVQATREKALGNLATYKLPLKISPAADHKMHD